MAKWIREDLLKMSKILQRKFAPSLFQCLSFLRDETFSNNYQLEAVSELWL